MIVDYLLHVNNFNPADVLPEILLFLLAAFFAIWFRDIAQGIAGRMFKLETTPIAGFKKRFSLSNLAAMGILLVTGMAWLTPHRTKGSRNKRFWAALAGPVANFLWCVIFLLVYTYLREAMYAAYDPEHLTGMENVMAYVLTFLSSSAMIHLSLALFNLLPVPGFSGGMAIGTLLSEETEERWMKLERGTVLVGTLLVLLLSRTEVWQTLLGTVLSKLS